MKNILATIIILAAGLHASAGEKVSQEEVDQVYALQCGTLEQVLKIPGIEVGKNGKLTTSELNELNQVRDVTLEILKRGKPAVKELLEDGEKQDTGPLGAILACGLIMSIESKLKAEGCLDLKSNTIVKGDIGIQACAEVVPKD